MEFEIYKPSSSNRSQFYLEQEDDDIVLHGIDENGDDWSVLRLEPNKALGLHSSVAKALGIPLDANGCVKTYKCD